MRWGIGLTLLAAGIALWIGTFLADPYTSWGVAEEQVRPSVARLGIQFASVSLLVSRLPTARLSVCQPLPKLPDEHFSRLSIDGPMFFSRSVVIRRQRREALNAPQCRCSWSTCQQRDP